MIHMHKHFISLTIISLLSSCAYPSSYEAQYDCSAWVKKGDSYTGVIKAIERNENSKDEIDTIFKDTENIFSLRKCIKDIETKQVLGLSIKNRMAGQTYTFQESQRANEAPLRLIDINLDWKVEKRFRY